MSARSSVRKVCRLLAEYDTVTRQFLQHLEQPTWLLDTQPVESVYKDESELIVGVETHPSQRILFSRGSY